MKEAAVVRIAKAWRYSVPSLDGEGWAILFLDSAGCFAALSDWGDFTYRWNMAGMPKGKGIREFLLGCGADDGSYLENKLSHGRREFDVHATAAAIRAHIIERREEDGITKEQAREEYDLADDLDSENISFDLWARDTIFDGAHDFYRTRVPNDIKAFLKHAWPRLRMVIAAELGEHHGAVAP